MEEISYKGEAYVKGADIARELGYTADYIGQLCRGKKVKCRQVGRVWYVNEDSVRAHKKSRYRSTLSKTKTAVKNKATSLKKQNTPKQAPSIKAQNISVQFESNKYSPKVISYEEDQSDLLPILKKYEESKEEQATATIPVRTTKEATLREKPSAGAVDIVWNDRPVGLTVDYVNDEGVRLGGLRFITILFGVTKALLVLSVAVVLFLASAHMTFVQSATNAGMVSKHYQLDTDNMLNLKDIFSKISF